MFFFCARERESVVLFSAFWGVRGVVVFGGVFFLFGGFFGEEDFFWEVEGVFFFGVREGCFLSVFVVFNVVVFLTGLFFGALFSWRVLLFFGVFFFWGEGGGCFVSVGDVFSAFFLWRAFFSSPGAVSFFLLPGLFLLFFPLLGGVLSLPPRVFFFSTPPHMGSSLLPSPSPGCSLLPLHGEVFFSSPSPPPPGVSVLQHVYVWEKEWVFVSRDDVDGESHKTTLRPTSSQTKTSSQCAGIVNT